MIRFLSGDEVEFKSNSFRDLIHQVRLHAMDALDDEEKYSLERYGISIFDPDTEEEINNDTVLEQKTYFVMFRPMKLLRWIDKDRLDWNFLSLRGSAVPALRENLDRVNWHNLSKNPNPEAISILRENLDRVDWDELSRNPSDEAFQLLEEHLDRVNWEAMIQEELSVASLPIREAFLRKHQTQFAFAMPPPLPKSEPLPPVGSKEWLSTFIDAKYWANISAMSSDIEFMRANIDKISFYKLSSNENPEVLPLMEEYLNKLDYWQLSSNRIAVPLLKENPGMVHYRALARNQNPDAIELLFSMFKKEVDSDSHIIWMMLSSNPFALPWLEKNQEKIDYDHLSRNPGIFQ